MTEINPNSISGITSITLPSGDGNVLTIHTNDGTERFRIDSSGNVKVGSACTISPDGDVFFTGVTTATTFTGAHSGSGANLTSLPAAQLTGTLPAISGANLTGIAATDNVRTGILDVAGVSTFRNTMNVGAAVTISESGIEASGIGITCANINGTQIGGRRNLIINGAMIVAQRGTSSSDGNGYYTVDRMKFRSGGNDETNTVSQITLNNTDTGPYQKGFRYAYRIQNGNQTGGAGTSDWSQLEYHPEAQDLANSGWDYTNSNSFITLSFWIRSSVGQRFYGYMDTKDGTTQRYSFAMDGGSALSANTWRFVSIAIPGNSNLQFDNNTDDGLEIKMVTFYGTDYTDNSYTMNNWAATGSNYMPDYDSTWYTTNDATWDITGLQLEVGSQATAFEHRSFGEEERLCQRYYFRQTADHQYMRYACHGQTPSANGAQYVYQLPVRMRATPTLGYSQLSDFYMYAGNLQSKTPTSLAMDANSTISPMFVGAKSSTFTAGQMAHLTTPNSEQGYLEFIADL